MERHDEFAGLDPVTGMRARLRQAEQYENSIALLRREAAEMALEQMRLLTEGRYSVVRLFSALTSGSRIDGLEREASEEMARRAGMQHDPAKPWIPLQALGLARRTLTVGTPADGGDPIGQQMLPGINALYPVSTVVRLGAQVFTGMLGDVALPMIADAFEASWPGEAGTATESSPTYTNYIATPKPCASFVRFSKQLLRQSPAVADAMIASGLLGPVVRGWMQRC